MRNVLGMLTQLEEGRWYLEDEKGNIPVDLSGATRTAGLFTEGVIVVARGLCTCRSAVMLTHMQVVSRTSASLWRCSVIRCLSGNRNRYVHFQTLISLVLRRRQSSWYIYARSLVAHTDARIAAFAKSGERDR